MQDRIDEMSDWQAYQRNGAYRLLLDMMRGQLDRRCRFVSCICCCFPGGDTLTARGECEGTLAYAPKGPDGFGYDPVFFVPGMKKTFAEMSPEEKNAVSHRGAALRQFRQKLEEYLSAGGAVEAKAE